MQEWGSKRELGVVSPAGGSFRTSVEDIAPGSKVRALIANKIELLDGYVSMDVQGQYVNTGCPENETWKTELGLAVNGASGNWSSIVCGTIDQFTIGRENNNGGTIRAKADDTILKDFGNIVLKAGGLVIDTQGHNLNVMNCVLNVVPGGKITVTGGGTVTFANCTASLTAKPSEKFLFADTDGVFSGMPTFTDTKGCKVKMSADSKEIGVVLPGFMFIIK